MVSDEDLVDEIQRLASNGEPPTCQEFDQDGQWAPATVQYHFGSWNAGVQAAGFSVNKIGEYSEKQIIEEIQRLASNEEPPTEREFKQDGRMGTTTVYDHFESWNNAVREAGFTVNQVKNIEKRQILQLIRQHSNGRQAPTQSEFNKGSGFTSTPIEGNTSSWWKGVVQAGLVPQRRFPLTASQFSQFHEAAINRKDPVESLIGLFLLFTGLPSKVILEVKQSWFEYLSDERYSTTLTVPNDHLHSDTTGQWTLKLPTSYTADQTTKDTQFPSLAEWFFTQTSYSSLMPHSNTTINVISHRIARAAEISRRSINHSGIGKCPDVPPNDLRASAGVQMARNGAPKRRIRRHLGIDHTGWDAEVEDFFLWLYQFEDFQHPDYDPPDVVLDPVSP